MKRGDATRLAVAIAVLASVTSLVAQSVRDRDPAWTAPAKAAATFNPLPTQAAVVAGGGKLYRQRCVSCHGDDGRGTDRAPSLVAADVQAQAEGELFWKITTGHTHRGMPSFSFLPEAQRWQLVMHLRGLKCD